MAKTKLKRFVRYGLDVLFVACNPPVQSNANGHYFSGSGSRFFELLHRSGLTTELLDKRRADIRVFGDTSVNFMQARYGVIDLVPDVVETASSRVKRTSDNLDHVIRTIRRYKPRFVCIIHSVVRDAFNKSHRTDIVRDVEYGRFTNTLSNCASKFIVNYFPNGNAISDDVKIKIFRQLKSAIKKSTVRDVEAQSEEVPTTFSVSSPLQ